MKHDHHSYPILHKELHGKLQCAFSFLDLAHILHLPQYIDMELVFSLLVIPPNILNPQLMLYRNLLVIFPRSEERRVGKECRSWWGVSPCKERDGLMWWGCGMVGSQLMS